MQQIYHSNASTNVNIRKQIQNNFSLSNEKLALQYGTSAQTISKWKNRDFQTDLSSRPKSIKYALSDIAQSLIVSIRKSTWFSIDQVWEMMLEKDNSIKRINVYRCFKKNNINKKPAEVKEKLKKFKEYEPGYVHIDVTYLPKLNGIKYYLFVAIDRASRLMYYRIYKDKSAQSAQDFFDEILNFFPIVISYILTDNGLEFTNKLLKSKKGEHCKKESLFDQRCHKHNIQHRLTLPRHPQTNGMVERANGIIKENTVAKTNFININDMEKELNKFLIYYNLERRHGSLRKELDVKTPFEAIEKWFKIKPELFTQNPLEFKNKILNLHHNLYNFHQQPGET